MLSLLNNIDLEDSDLVINEIDKLNKKINLNLIILNFKNQSGINKILEEYLVNLNKKILIISKNRWVLNNNFLCREEVLSGSYLTYFNNDIQYGSKYILKRFLDITLFLELLYCSVLYFCIGIVYFYLDSGPSIIKQNRVGLHGSSFLCINLGQ